jgi:hypothetical protein
MEKLRQIIYITLLGLLFSTSVWSQADTFYVEKKECTNSFHGNKLVLSYKNDTAFHSSFIYGYDLSFFISLDDNKKLLLVEKLLEYEDDTSHCCMKIGTFSFNGNEGCRGTPKDVKTFTIQVDALFMINRLCWPKLMELYSCSPVLYDKRLGKEINSSPDKIKCVFKEYKKWYAECKAQGKIGKYFPFNDGRYVWYGGRKSIAPKD